MAEKQATHRQQIEKTVIESNAFAQKVAPVLGFHYYDDSRCRRHWTKILKDKDAYGLAAIGHGFGVSWLACSFTGKEEKQRKEL